MKKRPTNGSPHPIAASAEVKQCRARIKQLGVEISDLCREKQRVQKKIAECSGAIQSEKDRLKAFEGKDIEVTDHAILRYLERVNGLDVESIVQAMISEDLRQQVATLGGTGKFPGPNGTRLVMENKRIISVIPSITQRQQ